MMHHDRKPAARLECLLVLLTVYFIPCFCFAEPSLEKIKTEFQHKDWQVRLGAIERLAGGRDEKTVDFLMSVAGNKKEQWEVQVRAIQLLGEIQNPKAAPLLLGIFESRSKAYECPAIKLYAALALANFGANSDIISSLIAGTRSDEPLVREASVRSLGKIGDRKAVQHLVALLNSESVAIRLSVIQALENIGNPQAVPNLEIVAKKDSDAVVRDTAKLALGTLQRR